MNVQASAIKEMLYWEDIAHVSIVKAYKMVFPYPPRPATSLKPRTGSVIVM
jgi:hypothetical protein